MADPQTYPPGTYVTVRGFSDGWAAVVAYEGAVLGLVKMQSRSEAFSIATRKAEHDGLPCLVERVV